MKKKVLLVLFSCLFLTVKSKASTHQADSTKTSTENKWDLQGILNFNLNWLKTSKEWQSGANNNFTIRTDLNFYANKKFGNYTSTNQLQIIYGWISDEEGERKNADLLWLRSVLSRPFDLKKTKWQASTEVDFRSQLQPGYQYTTKKDDKTGETTRTRTLDSEFLSPATIKLGLGALYKKNDIFNVMFSAVSGKLTIVMNDRLSDDGAFGVTPGEHTRVELGFGLNAQVVNWKPLKNLNYQGNLAIYSPYKEVNHTDLNYNSDLKFQFNNFISISLNTQIIYDHDIKFTKTVIVDNKEVERKYPALQVLNNLSLTISLDWKNKKETAE